MRKIVRELHKQFPGVEIEVTGHKHYRRRFPGGLIITTSGTHPAASYGPSGQRQPATSHSELNRVSGAYLRAFALDMNRPSHRRRRCLA